MNNVTKTTHKITNKPLIRLVVAYAKNRCIGKNNRLPWHLPGDLAHFKKNTLGHPIIMGRKTWDSIGRALPGRKNIVISKNPNFKAPGAQVYTRLDQVIDHFTQNHVPIICVIGGSQIYTHALPLANEIYATEINAYVHGDSFFPDLDCQWVEFSRQKQPAENGYQYDFVIYKKNK